MHLLDVWPGFSSKLLSLAWCYIEGSTNLNKIVWIFVACQRATVIKKNLFLVRQSSRCMYICIFRFYSIYRAVKFTSKLFGRALSKRIKATVLYATETGKSEQYAKQLCELLGHAFNAQVSNKWVAKYIVQ